MEACIEALYDMDQAKVEREACKADLMTGVPNGYDALVRQLANRLVFRDGWKPYDFCEYISDIRRHLIE